MISDDEMEAIIRTQAPDVHVCIDCGRLFDSPSVCLGSHRETVTVARMAEVHFAAKAMAQRLVEGPIFGHQFRAPPKLAEPEHAAPDAVPSPLEMVEDLHRAIYGGESWARPESPETVWGTLIKIVASLAQGKCAECERRAVADTPQPRAAPADRALSNVTINGEPQTWEQLYEREKRDRLAAQEWVTLVADLDRCQHGRHEGDDCSSCGGPSVGNPHMPNEGEVFGFDVGARAYVVPPRREHHKIEAWRAAAAPPQPAEPEQ